MIWTDERTAETRRLWADGFSAGAIAAELGGLTRSAVLGKIHRLGLQRADPQAVKIRAIRSRAVKPLPPKPYAPTQKPVGGPEPDPRYYCSILDLTNERCRWPVTDGEPWAFCGLPGADLADDEPYCRTHSRMAYRRPGEAA